MREGSVLRWTRYEELILIPAMFIGIYHQSLVKKESHGGSESTSEGEGT
jgi:hypothetical protein